MSQNDDQIKKKKIRIRESIAKVIFLVANLIVLTILIFDLIDYNHDLSVNNPMQITDLVTMKVLFLMIVILGASIFLTASYLPKKWICQILSIFEINFILILIVIHFIFDNFGYYTFASHCQRILVALLIGYVIIYLVYLFVQSFLKKRYPMQSLN